jgi:hypothetical protein
MTLKGPGCQIQRLQEKFMFNRHILQSVGIYRVSVGFIVDRLCHINVMDFLRPLFLNCPLPWGTNYPYTICCGLALINGLRALTSILPLTLGPYPTQFVDGPLGPLIYFWECPYLRALP